MESYGDRAVELLTKLQDLGLKDASELLSDQFIAGLPTALRTAVVASLTPKVASGFHEVLSELKNLMRLLPESVVAGKGDGGEVLNHEGKKDTRRCYTCGQQGHLKANCPKRKGKKKGDAGNANVLVMKADESAAAFVTTSPSDEVIFDSGTSHHIFRNARSFFECKPAPISVIRAGGGEEHSVVCAGSVMLDGGPHGPVKLTDVLLVPSICKDLISGPQLAMKGVKIFMSGQQVAIKSSWGRDLLRGSIRGRLYVMQCSVRDAPAGEAHVCSINLLHKRMGHPGQACTKKIAQQLGISGTPDDCDVCYKSKFPKLPFSRSVAEASDPLELVHSDVMGPMPIPSLGGARYVVTLLDDHSRMSALHFIAKKSEVPHCVKDTLLKWQRQTGKQLKVLRTDKGTEYKGALDAWLKETGVVHQLSSEYTPQQNGRAERLNRTLTEKTRALLLQHSLPQEFWAAAMDTASYLRNRLPVEGKEKTPVELFSGEKPDLSNLRVFGCLAYVHVPDTKRSKLDACAHQAVFVGYEQASKAWRLYVKQEKWKCVKSRHVRFVEHTRPSELLEGMHTLEEAADDFLPSPGWLETPMEIPNAPAAAPVVPEAPAAAAALEDQMDVGVPEHAQAADEDEDHGDMYEEAVEELAEGDAEDIPEEADVPADESAPDLHRAQRSRQPSIRLRDHVCTNNVVAQELPDHPASVKEALQRPDAEQFEQAIDTEMAALLEMNVFTETDLPAGETAIPSKFVLGIKRDVFGKLDKYKARLVALGCRQVAGRDYSEVFAPTVQHSTVRVLLAIAAAKGWEVHQTDVKTAFLNGELEERVYIRPPPHVRKGNKVWLLHKALYGLKQAARQWYTKLTEMFMAASYQQSTVDPCLFFKGKEGSRVFVVVHVDDALLVGDSSAIAAAKQDMRNAFDTKDLGPAHFFLGLEIVHTAQGIWVGQSKFSRDLLAQYGMSDCKADNTPMVPHTALSRADGKPLDSTVPYAALVGSLLYLTVNTRPDLAFVVGVLSRFMSNPREPHWVAAKRVLRYLAGTTDLGLYYNCDDSSLEAFSDADFAGSVDDRKSTSGLAVLMHGAAVMWRSKLQTVVATSTCEAEYIAAAAAAKEVLWLSKLLTELSGSFRKLVLSVDNQSALTLMQQHHAGVSGRTKHVDVNFHFLRFRVMNGDLGVQFVATDDQKADVLTKALAVAKLDTAVSALGLVPRFRLRT